MGQLRGKDLGNVLFLPAAMLRADGDVFLDNLSLKDVGRRLGVSIRLVTGPIDVARWVASKGGGNG